MTLKSYDEIQVGDRASLTRLVTDDMVREFADLSGDHNPLHLDDEFASRMRWKRRLAHGALSNAFVSAALTELTAGWVYLSQETTFLKPVFPGDTVTAEVLVARKRPRRRMVLETEVRTGDEVAARGTATMQELSEAFDPPN
ncbi:MAG: MaoC family dehydratase [Actinomycetota bacterium]|nr:MaoC family dehydratase [Actinomycetota bacterium]